MAITDNKAAQQSTKQMNADIESAKLEVLEKIAGAANKVIAPINNIQKAINLCATKLVKTNDLLNRNANNLKNVLKSLNAIKEQLKKQKGNEKDDKIGNLIKGAILGAATRKSAIATKTDDLGKLTDTVKLIAKQQQEQTKSADKNAQQIIKGSREQTKAVLLNKDNVEKAKTRESLLHNNTPKPSLNPDKNKKQKRERPVLPFSMKEFLKGLGGILSGILNPISIIAAMISKFLPYVLLAVAFFMGVWDGLSKEIQDKVTALAWKIGKYALIAFALFKGPVILIKTLETIYHSARMVGLTLKWGRDMILWAFQMKGEAKKQNAETGFLVFRKIRELIRHAAELAGIAFRNSLALMQFLLASAGIVLVVGAVLLLIGGIILMFVLFGDKIKKAVSDIIDVFRDIGSLIVDACIGFFKIVFSPVIALIEGIANAIVKAFFGGSNASAETIKKDNALVQPNNQENGFTELISKVTKPLNSIETAVIALRDYFVGKPIEASREFMTPMHTAIPKSAQISNMTLANAVTVENSDSINGTVNNNYVKSEEEQAPYSRPIENIYKTLDTLAADFKTFLQMCKQSNGVIVRPANK